MTVQEQPYPVVSRVVDIFGEWLKHRRGLREMREMDAANFGQIASELRQRSHDRWSRPAGEPVATETTALT